MLSFNVIFQLLNGFENRIERLDLGGETDFAKKRIVEGFAAPAF